MTIAPPPAASMKGSADARGAHRRHQVDGDARLPTGLVVARAEARGVVDEDVDAAERCRRGRDVTGNGRAVGEVASKGMRGGAKTGELGARRLERLLAPRADRHGSTRLREAEGNAAPDAAAAAGDDHALACEIERQWHLLA